MKILQWFGNPHTNEKLFERDQMLGDMLTLTDIQIR